MTTTTTSPRFVRLQSTDNVIVAVDPFTPDSNVEGIKPRQRVLRGHKMATAVIAKGEPVKKFGQVIGFASQPIAAGDWVHEHNVEMHAFARDYQFAAGAVPVQMVDAAKRATFQGYRRANGRIGTRNYVAILTSVNCSASVATFIEREVERSGILDDYPNVDGVISLVHGTGCGMADKGEGFDVLRRTQWCYA
jgi:altronate hydrolase